ncbi:hypothetical protein [Hymenobacter terrigena]
MSTKKAKALLDKHLESSALALSKRLDEILPQDENEGANHRIDIIFTGANGLQAAVGICKIWTPNGFIFGPCPPPQH